MDLKEPKAKPAVLVIDDSPVNLRTMKVFLENRFEIIPVKSGMEGLVVLKARKVDLILLDIDMPVMNGFDFLKQLKAMSDKAHIPVICVTGHEATPDFIGAIVSLGAKDFLTKPFEPDVLITKVARALQIHDLQI